MKPIEFSILGVGAWGSGFRNVDDLRKLFSGETFEDDGAKAPKPEIIPANERRRAPLPVKLAVESSSQACQNAKLDPKELSCVFVSGLGDTQLTDYMCKTLAGENKALSPTKFHNSVHNAAAGYWTISSGCMQAANSIAGYEESVPLTVLEALVQANAEHSPMLMTFYDAPVSLVLKGLLKNESAFSTSIVLCPSSHKLAKNALSQLVLEVTSNAGHWPDYNWSKQLTECYATNPAARILALIDLIYMSSDQTQLDLPLSAQRSLQIRRID